MGIHDLQAIQPSGGCASDITPGQIWRSLSRGAHSMGHRRDHRDAQVGVSPFLAAAAIGISALILASAAAFTALKWIGAAYLACLGVQMLRSSFENKPTLKTPTPDGVRQIFLRVSDRTEPQGRSVLSCLPTPVR
jgi:hypothetical protein